MVVDKHKNVYVTGYFLTEITVGDTTLSSADGKNTFLVRYKPGEGFVWAQSFRVGGGLFPSRYLACDAENNVVFASAFADSLRLGTVRLDTVAGENVFLAVLDSTGAFHWGVVAGGSIFADPIGCAADAGLNYYLTGEFGGQLIAGRAAFDPAGTNNFFLARAVEGSTFTEEQYSRPAVRISVNPNPADHIATLSYRIPVQGEVRIELYDMQGKKIRMLDDQRLRPGEYTLQVDVSGLPEGIYFLRVKTENQYAAVKMIVVK